MSAYREQKTCINDGRALEDALRKKGFKPVRHASARQLEGYHGDLRKQSAHIIIPRAQVGQASNDIGFKRQADGTFTAIISDFDKSCGYNDKWLKEVKALALESKANRLATEQLDLKPLNREVLPNGKIRLQYVQRSA